MLQIAGGITAPQGFIAAGVNADIKGNGDEKKDIALICSQTAAACAGVFTQNKYAAAPVKWSRRVSAPGLARAIVVNSGNANACTGQKGRLDAHNMANLAAEALNIHGKEVLVCSTGVIGVTLPMEKIKTGIFKAAKALSPEGGKEAALAIMTTDTFPKEVALEFELGGKRVRLGGMAKGSGMIQPNMATMLGFITSDIMIAPVVLKKALKKAADKTFNMLSIDGDTSTNDTVLALCNGMAGNPLIDSEEHPLFERFYQALEEICLALTKMMALDGEGATKFLEIVVENARTLKDAAKIAKAVAGSSLVKTAFFGEDANWGRIICAVGYSGAKFNANTVDIALESPAGREPVMENGAGLSFNEANAAKILAEKEIRIIINLHDGLAGAKAWGCDLSYDYVKINGSYRT